MSLLINSTQASNTELYIICSVDTPEVVILPILAALQTSGAPNRRQKLVIEP